MILSSSTLRFVALASLAASGMSSSIRGTRTENSELSQDKRNLVEIDMSIGLGKMACEEHPVDGSLVCTFRTTPPADLNTGRMVYDCLTDFCLSTEVNRIPFNEVPKEDTQIVDVVPPQKPSQPVNPFPVGSVGTCPARQQNTGLGCSQYIPIGQTSTVCLYGQTRCECKLQENNPAIAVGWNCFVVQLQTIPPKPPPVVLPAPTVAPRPVVLPNPMGPPVSNAFSEFQCRPLLFGCAAPHTLLSDCSGDPACCPGNILEDWRTNRNTCKHGSNTGLPVPRPVPRPIPNPVTNIDANINSVPSPAQSPVRGNSETVLAEIFNAPGCPATVPNVGDACTWGQRCSYYTTDSAGNRVAATDCGCTKFEDKSIGFGCREPTHPLLSF